MFKLPSFKIFSKKRDAKSKAVKKTIVARSLKGKFWGYTGENRGKFQIIFRLQLSVIPAISSWILCTSAYAFLVSVIHYFYNDYLHAIVTDNKVLNYVILSFNVVLSLLLVFRTNTAHERFWEGRKQWGALVNTVRNLARGIWIIVEEHDVEGREEKEAALRLVIAFAITLKLNLRREPVNDELMSLMSSFQYFKLKDVNHPSLEVAFLIGDYLQYQYVSNRINVYQLSDLHRLLDGLVDILGACERILKTPMPIVYTILLKTLFLIYFLILPWELVGGLTWWTAPIMAFISLILLGIDEIGSEIEEPFGHDPNDLPLDAICNTIRRNVEDLISNAPSSSLSCHIPVKKKYRKA